MSTRCLDPHTLAAPSQRLLSENIYRAAVHAVLVSVLDKEDGRAEKKAIEAPGLPVTMAATCARNRGTQAKGVKCGAQASGQSSSPKAPVPAARTGAASSQRRAAFSHCVQRCIMGLTLALSPHNEVSKGLEK